MTERSLSPEAVTAIRTVFLEPRETYTLEEAAALVGCEPGWFDQVRSDYLATTVAWAEVANYLMEHYTILRVEDALEEDAARVLPPLLRSIEVTMRLPRAYVAYLTAEAKERGWDVNELLTWELRVEIPHDKVRAMESDYPGIYAALRYPYAPKPVT
jgi:hypothetical protein